MPEPIHLAREIVNAGPTDEGAFVLTTFSQAQIDEMVTGLGTVGWFHDKDAAELSVLRAEPEPRALATFKLKNPNHRRALRDVLQRGTLHICAYDSVNADTGFMEGEKIAIDVRGADRFMIETALGTPTS